MLKKKEEALIHEPGPGVTRRLLNHGGRLMAVEFQFKSGAEVRPHTHPHEQIGVFMRGRFEATVGGKTVMAEPGDSCYWAPGVPHGVRCLEDGVILDVFTPIREDFLPGASSELTSPPLPE
ncbi:MAG: cupin domain-containing protein [Candidatus Glassbacteria bacterium]